MRKRNVSESAAKSGNFMHAKISELRTVARGYRDKNNEQIKELWSIDKKLLNEQLTTENKASIITQKEKLLLQIETDGYLEKLNALLEQIKALEIEVDGHSNIGSSPYIL
jgi:hypothetical protein